LLPTQAPLQTPVLAVAYRDTSLQPWLSLYNAATGEMVRQCTGHMDRIQSLAFSADGQLLASAAEDQMVSVWSLKDLGKNLGQHGLLKGVAVLERDSGLAVGQIDADAILAENQDKLRDGDILEGQVAGGRIRQFRSAFDFYGAIARLAPGKKVVLRVRGR